MKHRHIPLTQCYRWLGFAISYNISRRSGDAHVDNKIFTKQQESLKIWKRCLPQLSDKVGKTKPVGPILQRAITQQVLPPSHSVLSVWKLLWSIKNIMIRLTLPPSSSRLHSADFKGDGLWRIYLEEICARAYTIPIQHPWRTLLWLIIPVLKSQTYIVQTRMIKANNSGKHIQTHHWRLPKRCGYPARCQPYCLGQVIKAWCRWYCWQPWSRWQQQTKRRGVTDNPVEVKARLQIVKNPSSWLSDFFI